MSEQKHTPGKWKAVPNGGDDIDTQKLYVVTNDNRAAQTIAACDYQDEGEANARLIAAAPDLLAALVELIESNKEYESYFPDRDGISKATKDQIAMNITREILAEEKALAAISKAKGQP